MSINTVYQAYDFPPPDVIDPESPTIGLTPPAYHLPEATVVGRVHLQIADLTRSLDYYQRILGLRVIHHTDRSATLAPHGDNTPLIELHEHVGAVPVPRRGHLGLYHFAILLPTRAALGSFITHLAALGIEAGMSDHAVSEAIYLTDPDGLGIEVYADRPRAAWRRAGRQLYMTTAPLDVASLISAAAAIPWAGMPAGTRMGHIHLHVGDLDEATAFYHIGLGLDLMVWSYPGALFLSAGGYHHHLGTNTWVSNAARPSPGDVQLLEWELLLPTAGDVFAANHSLLSTGYTTHQAGSGWLAADPWGTMIRLRTATA